MALMPTMFFGQGEEMFRPGYSVQGAIPARSVSDQMITGRDNINLVPERALAGYALEHQDPQFMDSLQKFSVPGMAGQLTAFEINGDSMMPTITNGDIVICEPLERGDAITR